MPSCQSPILNHHEKSNKLWLGIERPPTIALTQTPKAGPGMRRCRRETDTALGGDVNRVRAPTRINSLTFGSEDDCGGGAVGCGSSFPMKDANRSATPHPVRRTKAR